MIEITSSTNLQFKTFLSLIESKGLRKTNLFLLSGKNLVQEYLAHNPRNLKLVAELITENLSPLLLQKADVKIYKLSKTLFNQIDVLGTHSPILVLEQPEIPEWNSQTPLPGLTVATPLGDPSNLGALIRSAEAFGVKNLILLQECANPFLPKSVKASSGSILRTNFLRGPRLQDFLTSQISNLIGLHMQGMDLKRFQWPQNGLLVLGEEGLGLPPSPNMKILKIPTENVESLNVTVAASIALYDYYSKSKKD